MNRGWGGFFREVGRRLKLFFTEERRAGGRGARSRSAHPFDEQNGVDTGGLIFGEQLDTSAPEAYWATAYYGISPSVFSAALDRLSLDWRRFTFVDIGCGKGRALMLAMGYSFRAVAGVELSPELTRLAEKNLEKFAGQLTEPVPATVTCGDAGAFELPSGPLVISIYHPFAAPVMRRFLAQVAASFGREPREIWMLYANPELKPMLEAQPWLHLVWDECMSMSEEDQAADRFGSTWERVVAYRSAAPAA